MFPTNSEIPQVEISTPDELLANAERFYRLDDSNMMRAAVLEAMAALETFVHGKVFSALESKLEPTFVRWLEEKTRMDFDSRLKVLAPVATGRQVDTRDVLWHNYQEARRIRNRVTHAGARVTRQQARFVIDTVYRWLAFLGSSVELQVALIGLQRYFERQPNLHIHNESDAVKIITRYFSKTQVAEILPEHPLAIDEIIRPDVILRFGPYTVVIEVMFANEDQASSVLWAARDQLRKLLGKYEATIGAVIVFVSGEFDHLQSHLQDFDEGKQYILVIPVKSLLTDSDYKPSTVNQ